MRVKNWHNKLAYIPLIVIIAVFFAGTASHGRAPVDRPTLTIEVFDRSNAPVGGGTCSNNWMTQQIQKQFGDGNNVTMKWIPIPRSQEKTKLNILMASGTAPDIVFTYDQTMFQNLALQGGLTDLTDLYRKTYNLAKFEGTNIEDGKVNGRIYSIPAKRSMINKHCAFIRQDLLEKGNLKMPTTAAEFEAVLKAFKKLQPDIIPYELVNTVSNSYDLEFGADIIIKSFLKTNISDLDYQTKAPYILPGYKEGIAFLNKLYNEGLIDAEFALDTGDSRLFHNISSGKVGFYVYDSETQYGGGVQSKEAMMEQAQKGAKMVPMLGLKNSDGKFMHAVYAQYGYYIMVPKISKNAAVAMKYLDWMATTAAAKFITWGQEGVHYKLSSEGVPEADKGNQELRTKQIWNLADYANIYNGIYAPTVAIKMKMLENDTTDYGPYANLYLQAYKASMTDTYRNYYYVPAFDKPIDAVLKYQSQLDELAGSWLVKCIIDSSKDFDQNWADFIGEFMRNGGKEIQDAKAAAYKTMHRK